MAGVSTEFEVEKIISCRVATDGRISYLVRWKGFRSDDDTWEPEEHLRGCKELVVEFFKERDIQPKSKDGYIILRLKQSCPRPSFSLDSSPGYSTSEYSPRKQPIRWADDVNDQRISGARTMEDSNSNHDDYDESRSSSEDSVRTRNAMSSRKLRLTPERQRRNANKQIYVRGCSLFHDEDMRKPRRRPRSRSLSKKNRSKSSYRVAKEDVSASIERQKRRNQHWHPVLKRNWMNKCKTVIFQVMLNAMFSLALVSIFYSILVYDLS